MRQSWQAARVSIRSARPAGNRALPRMLFFLTWILVLTCSLMGSPADVLAQSARSDDSQIIEKIEIVLVNPSSDPEVNNWSPT